MIKSSKHFIFLIFFILASSIYTYASEKNSIKLTQNEKNYLAKKQEITMCIDPDWMPYEKIQNGKHIGMSADFIKIIENKIGTKITLVPTKTWSQTISYAKNRKCDIFSLAKETPSRKKYMDFTKPYFDFPVVLATTTEKPFFSGIENILDKPIGIVKGYAIIELLKTRYPNINIVEVDSPLDGLKKVKSKELFGYLDSLITIGYELQRGFATELKISGQLDINFSLSIGSRNDEPHYGIEYDNKAVNLSKVNLCKNATTGCSTSCIYHQGIFKHALFQKNKVKQARLKRTLKFLTQRISFFEQLIKEISALKRKAKKKGLSPIISLNGTSDILWEKEGFTYKEKEYKNIMELFSDVQFFDYTKYNILKNRKKLPMNYNLIYSRAGTSRGKLIDNWEILTSYLDKKIDIAIVCTKKIKDLLLEKKSYQNYDVLDGDFYSNKIKENAKLGSILILEANKKTDINSSGFIIQTVEEIQEYLT
jgi:ABC-type amino acid transport substrate-binding protein